MACSSFHQSRSHLSRPRRLLPKIYQKLCHHCRPHGQDHHHWAIRLDPTSLISFWTIEACSILYSNFGPAKFLIAVHSRDWRLRDRYGCCPLVTRTPHWLLQQTIQSETPWCIRIRPWIVYYYLGSQEVAAVPSWLAFHHYHWSSESQGAPHSNNSDTRATYVFDVLNRLWLPNTISRRQP